MIAIFWQFIEERRNIKDRLLRLPNTRQTSELRNNYNDINKQIKRQARRDKRTYFENLAGEAEVAAAKGDIKNVYSIVRKLTNDKPNRNPPIKDNAGNLITIDEEQLKIWREHLKKTFNVDTQNNRDFPSRKDKAG